MIRPHDTACTRAQKTPPGVLSCLGLASLVRMKEGHCICRRQHLNYTQMQERSARKSEQLANLPGIYRGFVKSYKAPVDGTVVDRQEAGLGAPPTERTSAEIHGSPEIAQVHGCAHSAHSCHTL